MEPNWIAKVSALPGAWRLLSTLKQLDGTLTDDQLNLLATVVRDGVPSLVSLAGGATEDERFASHIDEVSTALGKREMKVAEAAIALALNPGIQEAVKNKVLKAKPSAMQCEQCGHVHILDDDL